MREHVHVQFLHSFPMYLNLSKKSKRMRNRQVLNTASTDTKVGDSVCLSFNASVHIRGYLWQRRASDLCSCERTRTCANGNCSKAATKLAPAGTDIPIYSSAAAFICLRHPACSQQSRENFPIGAEPSGRVLASCKRT